ncbi:MAG: hypothetical protein K0S07_306 [Chlamydiales bacterium]|jgi:hypothetical protein|nr:hypothetical protein [Chlamydiales bacterium]
MSFSENQVCCLRNYLYSPEEDARQFEEPSSWRAKSPVAFIKRALSYLNRCREKIPFSSWKKEQLALADGRTLRALGDQILILRPELLLSLSGKQWQALSDHQRSLVTLRRFAWLGSLMQRLSLEDLMAQLALWSAADVAHLCHENFALYQLALNKIADYLQYKQRLALDSRLIDEVAAVCFGGSWYALGVYQLKKSKQKQALRHLLFIERQLYFLLERGEEGPFERLLKTLPQEEIVEFLLHIPFRQVQLLESNCPALFTLCQELLLQEGSLPVHWKQSLFKCSLQSLV